MSASASPNLLDRVTARRIVRAQSVIERAAGGARNVSSANEIGPAFVTTFINLCDMEDGRFRCPIRNASADKRIRQNCEIGGNSLS
jgi:hypothetical protein